MALLLTSMLAPMGTDLTVFHVNPASYPAAPINMDTGDALGDLYFDLRAVVLPIECLHPSERTSHDCDNQEVVADDLVITKLVLDVKEPFGEYGRCNICVNGTDHHGNNSCVNGVYWCSCGSYGHEAKQCGPKVGYEDLKTHFDRSCREGDAKWECWKDATGRKTGGSWYSTDSVGYCGDGSAPAPPNCTWSVKEVVKVVNKSCSDDLIYTAVESAAYQVEAARAEGSATCFDGCRDSGVGPKRNTSSACWIECFFNVALGPDAGNPGGQIGGLPLEKMLDAWNAPFLPVTQGGCPPLGDEIRRAPPRRTAASWRGFPGFW